MTDTGRRQFIPIYGHSAPGKEATGFNELTLPDGVFVPTGEGSTQTAYVPRDDADLLRAYQRTDGESGNPEADALLAEIERRGLDV